MKKRLLFVLILAVSMVACGSKPDPTTSDSDVSIESTQDSSSESTPQSESAEESTQESVPESEPVKEIKKITIEEDLSLFGDLINNLFVITNDNSKKKTIDDVYQYLSTHDYDFYIRSKRPLEEVISSEEALQNAVKTRNFYVLHDNMFSARKKSEYNGLILNFDPKEDCLSCIQYNYTNLKSEEDKDLFFSVVNDYRTKVNALISEWMDFGYNMAVNYYDKDPDTWTKISILFNGDASGSFDPGYFVEISVVISENGQMLQVQYY